MARLLNSHSNQNESPSFFCGALMWRGSITPRILPTLIIISCYSLLLVLIDYYWRSLPSFDVTPFEYTGVVLGLVLVFRTNAGYERWREARKLWGGIVNQSRNIVIEALQYGSQDPAWREAMVKWTIAFSVAARESLRNSKNFDDLAGLLNEQEIEELKSAVHIPLFVASKLAFLIKKARTGQQSIDGFEFRALEEQRILLINYIGSCERILKTPIPLVYAIKIRRFIFIFLLLLPFSLIERAGFSTVFVFF